MPFNWDVSGISRSFWGQVFEAFATSIRILAVPNVSPEQLRIGQICLSVCLSVVCSTFCRSFFGPMLNGSQSQFHEKSAPKTGSRAAHDAERDPISDQPPCRGRCTLLKWRLRRHLPIRPNWWRRSCQRTPVAPPAPAGSILVEFRRTRKNLRGVPTTDEKLLVDLDFS